MDLDKMIDEAVGSDPDAVGDILRALATAVRETASHVEGNWQDKRAAREWERIATKIDAAEAYFQAHKPY